MLFKSFLITLLKAEINRIGYEMGQYKQKLFVIVQFLLV